MDILHVIILAIVQGVTEFVPISSSAHLVFVSTALDVPVQAIEFDIVLHAGTLLAVFVYFAKDITSLLVGVYRKNKESIAYVTKLFIATLPIVVVGLLIYDQLADFRLSHQVAALLFLTAPIPVIADMLTRRNTTFTVKNMYMQALWVGIAQVFAIFPGISRSGFTIAAGRLVGFTRTEATRFSILLSIPTIMGAFMVALHTLQTTTVFAVNQSVFVIGFFVAALVGYATISVFIRFVERIGFAPFMVYQMLLAVSVLLFI